MRTVKELKPEIQKLKSVNRLYRFVINDLIDDSEYYSGNSMEKLKARCMDVSHGCSSGIVGHLIYYSDTTAFFKRYRKEIEELLKQMCLEVGEPPYVLLHDFDQEDWFCHETNNQNLLAWFGYEEVNHQLLQILESD